jgi:hypothetical protein
MPGRAPWHGPAGRAFRLKLTSESTKLLPGFRREPRAIGTLDIIRVTADEVESGAARLDGLAGPRERKLAVVLVRVANARVALHRIHPSDERVAGQALFSNHLANAVSALGGDAGNDLEATKLGRNVGTSILLSHGGRASVSGERFISERETADGSGSERGVQRHG